MSQAVNKLPSNRLVKWKHENGMAFFFPVGLNPNDDEEWKKFGLWKLATEQRR